MAHKIDGTLLSLGIIACFSLFLGGVKIQTAKAISRGTASPVRITVLDDDGIPSPGLQPLEITISDAARAG